MNNLSSFPARCGAQADPATGRSRIDYPGLFDRLMYQQGRGNLATETQRPRAGKFLLLLLCVSVSLWLTPPAFAQNVTNLPTITVPSNSLHLYGFTGKGPTNQFQLPLTNLFQPPLTNATGASGTNYTLLLIPNAEQQIFLGGSNVNVLALYGGTPGFPQRVGLWITNLSADVWGLNFSPVTNRFIWSGPTGETNAPSTVLSNNIRLHCDLLINGTNVFGRYRYYRPGI